jgi:hypothetical protein
MASRFMVGSALWDIFLLSDYCSPAKVGALDACTNHLVMSLHYPAWNILAAKDFPRSHIRA